MAERLPFLGDAHLQPGVPLRVVDKVLRVVVAGADHNSDRAVNARETPDDALEGLEPTARGGDDEPMVARRQGATDVSASVDVRGFFGRARPCSDTLRTRVT